MVASSGSNSLAETLLADLRKVDPAEEPERAEDILSRIKDIPMSRAILKKTGIGRVVGRIARKAPPRVAAVAKPIVKRWKSIVCEERKGGDGDSVRRSSRARSEVTYNEEKLAKQFNINGPPPPKKSDGVVGVTATGLKCKPAPTAEILDRREPLPQRSKATGKLKFADRPDFTPNLTPAEVLRRGSFGGTYFRSITSAVTGCKYRRDQWKEFPKDWFEGLDIKRQVTAQNYNKGANKYGVKCGGDLDMWETSGWISNIDPYGWYQWYCRFYMGRRSTDDDRQIGRWRGVCSEKGRFRNQLIGKIYRAGTTFDDVKISPVIRQALQHWGYVLTEKDYNAYCKLKGWR